MNFGQFFGQLGGKIAAWSTKQKAIAAALAVVVVAGGVAAGVALSGSGSSEAAPPPPSTSATTPKPTPTPTPTHKPTKKPAPKPAPVNPLTGVGAPPKGPVIAVKIDDTAAGRPQIGIDKADIVYVEEAEGGLTRLIAVFASKEPWTVGPVRSVRASDPELLSAYGRISLAHWGGAGDSIQALDSSIVNDADVSRYPNAYSRDGGREMPYNGVLNVHVLAGDVKSAGPRNVGFTWSANVPGLARMTRASTINATVGSTPVNFVYDPASKRYVRVIDGVRQQAADGAPVRTPNVLVLFCKVTANAGDVDVAGNISQFTHSTGSGNMVLFRDGHRINGTWSRAGAKQPFVYKNAHGKPIAFKPGGVWVVLSNAGAPLSSS